MNKRLIIIFVCIAVFVLTLVLGAVIFTINDVDILLSSEQAVGFDKVQILNTSGIKQGQSIFTVDEKDASASIEKSFPKLKVIKIERSFPNKVRVHLDVRKPILKCQIKNSDKIAILDRELKVLDIVSDEKAEYSDDKITILTDLPLEVKQEKDFLGTFLSKENKDVKNLDEIIKTLETFKVVNERFSATFASVKICNQNKEKLGISFNTRLGIKIYIRTNTTIKPKTQCEMLYNKFFAMGGEEREQDKFIYVNDGGGIEVRDTLIF